MKRKKNASVIGTLVFSIFAIVGIGLLIGGIFLLKNGLDFKEKSKETTAVITQIEPYWDSDGNIHHHVYVTYSVDGETYEDMPLNYYHSGMRKGKEITISYDPDDPERISSVTANIIAAIVLLVFGVVLGMVGVISLLLRAKRKGRGNKLRENGRVLHAKVVNVDINRHFAVNGRNPSYIICEYQDDYSGKTYRFKSENIWEDVILDSMEEQYIDVYVDPNDFSKYSVDAEGFLSGLQSNVIDFT